MANILIVDDDLELSEIVGEVLQDAGHVVRTARDGQEGLDLVREHYPDLVLLDVEMPVLTGPEMSYRMFLHDLGEEEIPIVLLSGVTNLFRVAELVGTPYYLPKPYGLETLMRVVDTALAERRPPTPGVQGTHA